VFLSARTKILVSFWFTVHSSTRFAGKKIWRSQMPNPRVLSDMDLARFIGEVDWRFDPNGETLRTPERFIDRRRVAFSNMMDDARDAHSGKKRIKRLREARQVCLGPEHFFDCWTQRGRLPEEWKRAAAETRYMYFDGGRHLVNPSGDKYVFCMWWESEWRWRVAALSKERWALDVTVVLSPT
jgi:hypothetical protein